jgi:FkbM family methyltransferase
MGLGVDTYRWCLSRHVQTKRGGTRLMRAIQLVTPSLGAYPIQCGRLAPFYINLMQPSWQEVELFLQPTEHEPNLQAIFRALINPADTVVDVGANLGRHLVLLDALAGYVHAVEPNPALWANLQRTKEGLQHTMIHKCALGEQAGYTSIDVPTDHSMARVKPGGDIPVFRMDALFANVALIKVDVEGFEASVFRGGERMLNAPNAPIVIFEELRQNQEAHDVLASFTQADYAFWVVPKDGAIVPYTADRPEWCDVLAIPAKRYEQTLRRLQLRLASSENPAVGLRD